MARSRKEERREVEEEKDKDKEEEGEAQKKEMVEEVHWVHHKSVNDENVERQKGEWKQKK